MATKKSTKTSSKKNVKKPATKRSTPKKTNTKSRTPTNNAPKVKAKSTINTMLLINERDIAMDFAAKAYKEFNTMLKSVVLFGSAAREDVTKKSDIDIIILLDDVSIKFDEELISWYRKRLAILLSQNKYQKPLHISSVKLSTWWDELIKGDPVVINILRYGEPLIDMGGFFNPLRILLKEGKIKSTPEAIYTLLERSPSHLAVSRSAMLQAVEGIYWSMVDAAHAALIAANIMPSSPEEVSEVLTTNFVDTKLMDKKYVKYYDIAHKLSKEIAHQERTSIDGKYIDEMFVWADEFLKEMSKLTEELVKNRK